MKLLLGTFVALVIWIPCQSVAAPCTDGVDCYCDRIADPLLAKCEDWEERSWYDPTGPYPWHKEPSNFPGFRGGDGIFQRTYGAIDGGCAWTDGQPANPKHGSPCVPGGAPQGAP